MKNLCFGVLILCFCIVMLGCSSQYKKEFMLERPVAYEQSFKTAVKTAYDLNMSIAKTDKDTGIVSAYTMKNRALELVGGTYAQEIEIYLERDKSDEVNRIVVTGGAAGGMIPHSKMEAKNLCQSYFEKLKENLKKDGKY